jgi:hypothetical protein
MSMIFDGFSTRAEAERFVASVAHDFGLSGSVHDTVESSDAADPFPFTLTPPIAHVDRAESPEVENQVEMAVLIYGGTYAGT